MRIMISCGEPSGDLYSGALATELQAQAPGSELFGLGGARLKAAGATLVGDFAGLAVTGLTEAVRVLPRSYAMYRRLVAAARERKPDVCVLVDFPDFNFRLLAPMRRLGVPVVYYISPQLWAWRPGRMRTMSRFVDKVLVIFPFEAPLYEQAGIPVQHVGHPLVDLPRPAQTRSSLLGALGLAPDGLTVALLPGSRPNEIRRIVPGIAGAMPLIRSRVPGVQFIVAGAPGLPPDGFAPLTRNGAVVVHDCTDDVLAASDVVVTASGTATVQAALHERPMVVVYRVSLPTYWLGKSFLNVDTFAMPNLVAGRRIVPELIQDGFTPERVADETVGLLTDARRRAQTSEALKQVREQLGAPGASARAAAAILDVGAGASRRTR
ncbi:MAG: lipid-A-disaccharide synthase [Acidobacteria bacterium]|nr:lipid-A-disaccharide synthase [Acidobacteriota bacterium]